jgi:hypothetical protein
LRLMFSALKQRALASQFTKILKDFCLSKLDSWSQLFHAPLDPNQQSAIGIQNLATYINHAPQAFLDMATAVHCTRYLLDQDFIDPLIFSNSVFAQFWSKLILLCDQMWTQKTPYMTTRLMNVIGIMNGCVFTNAACKEIEAFYDHLETLCVDNESSAIYADKQVISNLRVSHGSL